jgi:hypothetical protein
MAEHFTKESEGRVGSVQTYEDAVRAHHLATADPEPERDGLMTGPSHEKKYNLEREADSAEQWRARGVHPYENRALRPGEDGFENLRGAAGVETAESGSASENVAAPRASRK